jgi:hypothetical protein
MALEAVVFPQDPFAYSTGKDLYNLLGGNWSYDHFGLDDQREDDQQGGGGGSGSFDFLNNQTENCLYGDYSTTSSPPPSMVQHLNQLQFHSNASLDATSASLQTPNYHESQQLDSSTTTRPKRRRAKSRKNKEEIESQRMTHIAVERNRRKQMNEYLSVLRSLMPDSYVQRVSLFVPLSLFILFYFLFYIYIYILAGVSL